MMSMFKKLSRAAVFAVLGSAVLGLSSANFSGNNWYPLANAIADEDGDGGKGAGYRGPHGMGKQGSDRPNDPVPGKGGGQGGPSGDSDAKGPRYGGGGAAPGDEAGGKPVWAQEGVPEGDYGRLNVVRAPSHVIDRSLLESYANLSANSTALYELKTLQEVLDAIAAGDLYRVDSPLENLGLYRDLLTDGKIGSDEYPDIIQNSNILLLAGLFLGSASDKTMEITENTSIMVNTVLGIDISTIPQIPSDEVLASVADQIREAILTAHGE